MLKEFIYYIKTDWKECVRVYLLIPNVIYQALKSELRK
jgi:hypothetical protein